MFVQKFTLALAAVPAIVSAAPAYGGSSGSVITGPIAAKPDAAKLAEIAKQAGGSLSNGPPPSADLASPEAITNFQLVAFNELFETAFFTELIANITTNKPGYAIGGRGYRGKSKKVLLEILERVQAQEVLHTLNANGALKALGSEQIQPCKYKFPVSNLEESITFAATFTNVVLGTLQDIQQVFAQNPKQSAFVRGVGSTLGQEGEQEGFYNAIRGKFPSSSPFLTTSVRDFAFTAINSNIVPGSCPNKDIIKLKEFKPLTLVTPQKKISPKTKELEFSWPAVQKPSSIVYISGGSNVPTVVDFEVNKKKSDKKTTFVTASFPFDVTDGFVEGLTIAAATKSKGPFKNAGEVSKDTIFGPATILVESDL
ncbi:MAG: hypothetical protein M1831_001591 [Alyxoria varia]|nr:MAG: hypothetical protein M1831_001591 [Alyxoria varia]